MAYRAVRARDDAADRWFDFWRGVDNLVALGGTPSYYGLSHEAGVFHARLSHWRARRNALGAALRVILSMPQDEPRVIASYRLAAMSIPGVREEHLPILLWYRDLVQHEQEGGDARQSVLSAMTFVIRRDLWSDLMTPGVLDLVEQWRTLVAAGAPAEHEALIHRSATT
jgi:hypothetical protein